MHVHVHVHATLVCSLLSTPSPTLTEHKANDANDANNLQQVVPGIIRWLAQVVLEVQLAMDGLWIHLENAQDLLRHLMDGWTQGATSVVKGWQVQSACRPRNISRVVTLLYTITVVTTTAVLNQFLCLRLARTTAREPRRRILRRCTSHRKRTASAAKKAITKGNW